MTHPSSMAFNLYQKSEKAYETSSKEDFLHNESHIVRVIDSQFLSLEKALTIEESSLYSATSIENLNLSRAIAQLIINDQGDLETHRIKEIYQFLKEKRKSLLSIYAEERNVRLQHLVHQIDFLMSSHEAQQIIRRIAKPYANRLAERAVLDTMGLPLDHTLTDADTRRAVITALFTKLRQSLGSCFATAPAIMLQEEQPLIFLKDIEELISTGKLTKIVQGVEYTVPMSRTWGNGELNKGLSLSLPLEDSQSKVWLSPVILAAFKAVGEERVNVEFIQSLFEVALQEVTEKGAYQFSFTADGVISLILQRLYNISETELQEFDRDGGKSSSISLQMQEATSIGAGSLGAVYSTLKTDDTLRVSPSAHSITEKLRLRAEREKRAKEVLLIKENVRRHVKMQGECALLKLWEFTIASFTEVQFDLCRWNFYSSLGFNWDDEGGIGQVLYSIGKECVDEANRELEQEKERFDAINIEVSYLEQRVRQASTEQELAWIKMEYQSRKTEQYHIQQLCDQIAEKAKRISNIHQFLIDQYDRLLKTYFQEVYDADLHDVDVGPFDDSPAGFRLIYKYGRSNPSLWTPITSLDEFINALASFFTLTEQELVALPEINGIEKEFTTIITRLVTHIRSRLFQESALNRTLVAHGLRPIKNPIENVSSLEKKPWVFTSGGSMTSLVSSYFKLERQIDEEARWVENETELFAFLIDTTRLAVNRLQLDNSIRKGQGRESLHQRSSQGNASKSLNSLLMHSPTHAFRLLPEIEPFRDAWSSDMYSYSWINNKVRDPGIQFLKESLLPPSAIEKVSKSVANLFPLSLRMRAKEAIFYALSPFMRTFDVYKALENACGLDAYLRDSFRYISESGHLAEFFYTHFPYTEPARFLDIAQEYFQELENSGRKLPFRRESEAALKNIHGEALSSTELKEYFISAVANAFGSPFSQSIDVASIICHLRRRRALFPKPVIVADSNWVKDYFAFLVSPITQEVEFWAVSRFGTYGRPIPHWKRWLNGSDKSRMWGVFVSPSQYRL